MSSTVTASDGTALPLDSLAVDMTWSGSFISTMSVQYPNIYGVLTTYVLSFTNDGTNITGNSEWVAQP